MNLNSRIRFVSMGLAATVLAGAAMVAVRFRPPPPEIPVPPNLAQLEPQLRDYVAQNLSWAREKPRRPDRHATLGLIYGINGLWLEARGAFQNAAQLNPAEPLAQMYVGIATEELNEIDEALKTYRAVVARFPNFAPGFYRLGQLLLRSGVVDEAEPAFQRLTELAPQEWRGFAGLGEIQLRQGRAPEAAALLERAVELDPTAKTPRSVLGQAYRALGRTEDADIQLNLGRNAVKYPMPDDWSKDAPKHARLLQDVFEAANNYAEEGQPAKAVEILAKAFVYHPDNVNLMNRLAIALNRAQQPNKARAILNRALEKDSNNVPSLITLALVQHNLEENEAALATAGRAIALAPKLAQPFVAKANALLGLEHDQEALAALEAAALADPQNAEIPAEMGDVLWGNLKRPEDAKRFYEKAVQLDPVSIRAHARLVELSLELGELSQAEAALARLRKIAPRLPDVEELAARVRKAARP